MENRITRHEAWASRLNLHLPNTAAAQKSTARYWRTHQHSAIFVGIAAALAASAFVVRYKTRQAEQQHPAQGKFIEIDGVRLHYIEQGQGEPLVLLHGNGSMVEELEASGLVNAAAEHYRVIVFDRPGYGHSERPLDKEWTPAEQADLLHRALSQIGIEQAIFLGHSWGTLVALAMAFHYPQSVRGLVLLSGYYFPSLRLDAAIQSVVATPVIGSLMRHTVSPLLSRLSWKLILRRMFGPNETPARFSKYPTWLALRPSQLLAAATEGKLMIPSARAFEHRYRDLSMPVRILAGEKDRMVGTLYQSERLHKVLPQSELQVLPDTGHMLHYFAIDKILAAVDSIAQNQAVASPSAYRSAPVQQTATVH